MIGALYGCITATVVNEEEHDKHYNEFKFMVEMAECILEILNSEMSKTMKFNFDSYTVIPLFMTALKCRDLSLRRRAISLMFKYHRKEGVCDSICMGKLCEWAMMVEEEHLKDQRVPGWARIHGVTLRRGREDGACAFLTCEQRSSATSDEVVTRSTSISWNFAESLTGTTSAHTDYWMGR